MTVSSISFTIVPVNSRSFASLRACDFFEVGSGNHRAKQKQCHPERSEGPLCRKQHRECRPIRQSIFPGSANDVDAASSSGVLLLRRAKPQDDSALFLKKSQALRIT